jgi:6,7-dimethyl-8-ribityllumazine synthase
MIRNLIVPRVLGKTREDLQPAIELFRALGATPGRECDDGSAQGYQLEAPRGTIEFLASASAPLSDLAVEVSDADAAWEIVRKRGVKVLREIADAPDGSRFFAVEVSGMKVTFLTYANKQTGVEGSLNAVGRKFAIVVARFNSFITERLLDGALLALSQAGAAKEDITVVRVPGAFEIPSASRRLAESGKYDAIICIGCLLRGDTLHYDVIANEVTRGIGQSAQETGVPHAFGVLTCDTLEQAIDRAGLKAGNKGYEAGLAAVEMASLHSKIGEPTASATAGKR